MRNATQALEICERHRDAGSPAAENCGEVFVGQRYSVASTIVRGQ
jgi:hypothetical protein